MYSLWLNKYELLRSAGTNFTTNQQMAIYATTLIKSIKKISSGLKSLCDGTWRRTVKDGKGGGYGSVDRLLFVGQLERYRDASGPVNDSGRRSTSSRRLADFFYPTVCTVHAMLLPRATSRRTRTNRTPPPGPASPTLPPAYWKPEDIQPFSFHRTIALFISEPSVSSNGLSRYAAKSKPRDTFCLQKKTQRNYILRKTSSNNTTRNLEWRNEEARVFSFWPAPGRSPCHHLMPPEFHTSGGHRQQWWPAVAH